VRKFGIAEPVIGEMFFRPIPGQPETVIFVMVRFGRFFRQVDSLQAIQRPDIAKSTRDR
jgi:hypothetical protein